jgi:hypothetical protein
MNAHRLNHHDIQAVKAFEVRAQKKARAKRFADRLVLVACVLAAVLLLGLVGGSPR